MSKEPDEIPGLSSDRLGELQEAQTGGEGMFRVGQEGVRRILKTRDEKVDFIAYRNRTLAFVHSQMGYPAIYPLPEATFEPPARAVLMDLDGTSVHSEHFWIWIIERTTAALVGDDNFRLEPGDAPYVSGHSVSEHLQYCINKYCPAKSIEEAREHYFDITHREMERVLAGEGKVDSFVPAPGLKDFLLSMKENGVQIGLVTSGLHEKAWPEIVAAFRQMGLGDPRDFYDAIITAGHALRPGQPGTLGELEPKPHPWLYAETASVGLGIRPSESHRVVGIEDSGAGVVSLRLAGFATIGVTGGNIEASGVRPLLHAYCDDLDEAKRVVLGTLPQE